MTDQLCLLLPVVVEKRIELDGCVKMKFIDHQDLITVEEKNNDKLKKSSLIIAIDSNK